MTLLKFVLGPPLRVSIGIMLAGIFWRLVGNLLVRRRAHLGSARTNGFGRIAGGVSMMISRSIPRRAFWQRIGASVVLSTVFHVGLLVILLGGAAHILLFKEATGLSWRNLPTGLVTIASGVTLGSMLILLARRLISPVLQLLSTADDYLSWLFVFLPVFTGMLLAGGIFGSFSTLLSLHILTVEMLMIWFPFGKLMHGVLVFPSRGAMGANFARKGAAT